MTVYLKDCVIVRVKTYSAGNCQKGFDFYIAKNADEKDSNCYFRVKLNSFDLDKMLSFFTDNDFSNTNAIDFCEKFIQEYSYDIACLRGMNVYDCFLCFDDNYTLWHFDSLYKKSKDRILRTMTMDVFDFMKLTSITSTYEEKKNIFEKFSKNT